MADRPWQPSDAELERALADLGKRVAYPPTPDLSRVVRSRLEATPRRPGSALLDRLWPIPSRLWRPLVVAALALLLLGGSLLTLSPAARTAVAERLGLRGIAIVHQPTVLTPTTGPVAASLHLGERVSLDEARRRVAYPVVAPTLPELGTPDEIYVDESVGGGQVALVYRARPGLPAAAETGVGLLVTQFRGDLDPGIFGKGLGPDTRLEQVTVNGGRGFWIEGKPHLFYYRDANGDDRSERVRLAGNVLLWEQGDLTLRLEGAPSKDEAMRIAASIR